MRQAKLRNHYLRTQYYISKFPNDLVAREAFNQFILSLQCTNTTIYAEVTNSEMTDDERYMVSQLSISRIRPKKIKKDRYENNDQEEDAFAEAE